MKPIVILAPQAEREALRNSGVLSSGLFREFGAGGEQMTIQRDNNTPNVWLWPHEIDYKNGKELAERVLERPADIPVFFGMAKAVDDAERESNETEITRLLNSIAVHVLFLDERGGDGSGYAQFHSFAEIAEWSGHFNTVLRRRFPNENALHQTENILIIIARGAQVKVSDDAELKAFDNCVGEGKAFKSCYFLDYNLEASSGELFHARVVWPVMVGRLLLRFILSEENDSGGNSSQKIWQRPGVKIWRACECVIELAADAVKKGGEEAQAKAFDRLKKWVDNSKGNMPFDISEPRTNIQIGAREPNQTAHREIPPAGWSEFGAAACAEETANPGRWQNTFDRIRNIMADWHLKWPTTTQSNSESKKVFSLSHEAAGHVFGLAEGLSAAMTADRKMSDFENDWREIVKVEKERREKIDVLKADAGELEKAQRHFAGWGLGIIVVMALSAMCGWGLHRLVSALGGGGWMSLWLAGTTAAGAFAALCVVIYIHRRAGIKGAETLIQTAEDADKLMERRDEKAFKLFENASGALARMRRLNSRFRAWALLARIRSIIITEIQPAETTVKIDVEEGEATETVNKETGRSNNRKEDFEKLTRTVVGPLQPGTEDAESLSKIIEQWWGDNRQRNDNFQNLWNRLCKEDKHDAGHFPASLFVKSIRDFVARFANDIRLKMFGEAVAANSAEVNDALKAWVRKITQENTRQFASAAVTAKHDDESNQQSGKFFVQSRPEVQLDELREISETSSTTHGVISLDGSELLKGFGQIGFFYQEFTVSFARDEKGFLIFQEVPDGG